MFIDGLDEFDGHYDHVIERITELSDQRHVKICVSSRPLLAFEMAFKGKPSLRLQDLTFNTIREYTDKQLSHLVQQHASSNGKTKQRAEKLLQMIVHRADGVFLWAVIATREVRVGLQGLANLDELAQAIEVLPPELEGLFMLILGRIKPAFQRDAAKFLQIVLTNDMYDFDLCRLYLISSQQELQDAPFVYENVTMSELTAACHTFETRLLSHTAGLLELTSGVGTTPEYCKRKDWDPISFTRVDFIHRTVRDFLLDNKEAKSFLSDYGLSEAQIHMCIARGTLAHLAQHSQGDAVPMKVSPHPMLYPFSTVLRHVSQAERISRSVQSKFIQSLDYASLVRGYIDTQSPKFFSGTYQAFQNNGDGTLVDVVGMAAAVGMTIYVCEQLGLPVSSAGYYPSLPDLEKYSTSRTTRAYLSWETADQSTDTTPHADTLFRPSIYRQALTKCLRWEEDTQMNSGPDDQAENHSLAESYILCCYQPAHISMAGLDIVRMLLKAGANPLVRVRAMDWKSVCSTVGLNWCEASSFWEKWLLFLGHMRHNYMVANGKSGGLLFEKHHIEQRVTLSDIFDVTKALLAHGADINGWIYPSRMNETFLKRLDLNEEYHFDFNPEVSCSTMFILEECFNGEPGFQKFAAAVRPLLERRTRERRMIFLGCDNRPSSWDRYELSSADEFNLWPLIEKWESTGYKEDLVAVETTLCQIWEARHSAWKSKRGIRRSALRS